MDSPAAANAASAATEAAAAPATGQKRPANSPLAAPSGQDSAAKKRKSSKPGTAAAGQQDASNDCYCWICHKEGEVICCETCPRVFHLKCIQLDSPPTEDWVCPECVLIMTAENMDTRSRAMRLLNVDQLCILLRHALSRMRSVSGVEPFLRPVDPKDFPAYKDYVAFPMNLQAIEKNVKKKHYGSTEAFLADTKWILHNCVIFNSTASKLTSVAKTLVKVCKHEMQEIENCPDCYTNAHAHKDSWFVAACRIPHLLVWAKLKGFPFWPGKVMRVNSEDSVVDIRFFGAHDRAWIPLKDVFLYSEEAPAGAKNPKRKGNLEECLDEVDLYIKAIEERFAKFEHASLRTPFDPRREEEQIKMLYPKCMLPFELGTSRRRTRAYSFSGSERSQTGTPTPSEIGEMAADESQTKENDGATGPDVKEPPSEKTDIEKGGAEEEPMGVEKGPEESAKAGVPKEPPKLSALKSSAKESDRTAVSPPCEVSSTTPQTEGGSKQKAEAATKEESSKEQRGKEEDDSKPKVKVAVIAETSETVEIEGEMDEEEPPVVEEEDVEEIDDVEPDASVAEKSSGKEASKECDGATGERPKDDTAKEMKLVASKDKDKQSRKESATGASMDEDEIDDVEPDVEEILDDDDEAAATEDAPVDTSRLQAAGISVTMVEKRKVVNVTSKEVDKQPTKEGEEKKPDDKEGKRLVGDISLGIGSDISVTVVQKKKEGEKPRISVKSESELLEDRAATKDVVNVHLHAKGRKSFLPKSTESPDETSSSEQQKEQDSGAGKTTASAPPRSGGKSPPDPIVTISKVQGQSKEVSAFKPSQQTVDKSARLPGSGSASRSSPVVSSSATASQAPSSSTTSATTVPPTVTTRAPPPAHVAPGSLASILGAPRPPALPPQQPGYRGTPSLRPPTPASTSLLRMGALGVQPGFRGTHPPPQPTGPMGMPSLHPRPPPGGLGATAIPTLPPAAGPVSEQMQKMASKLVDYMRGTLEDLFRELASQGSLEAQVKALQLEMEKMQWRHQQELSEAKHNRDLIILEMRQSMESERQKIISDLKKQADIEKQKAIAETKKKQWCAHCGKEAIFYCCWNTSYCDYPCQQAHWPAHMSTCAQNQANQEEESPGADPAAPSATSGPPLGAPEGVDPSTPGGHFLSGQAALAAAAAAGQPPQRSLPATSLHQAAAAAAAARTLQGGAPSMMGMGGLNPRMMGMRFPPRGSMPPGAHLRFPTTFPYM